MRALTILFFSLLDFCGVEHKLATRQLAFMDCIDAVQAMAEARAPTGSISERCAPILSQATCADAFRRRDRYTMIRACVAAYCPTQPPPRRDALCDADLDRLPEDELDDRFALFFGRVAAADVGLDTPEAERALAALVRVYRSDAIPIDLPRPTTPAAKADSTTITIIVHVVAGVNRVEFPGRPPLDASGDLEEAARQAAGPHPEAVTVIVEAGPGVAHGAVVHVMEALRRVGIVRLAIATRSQ